MMGYEMRSLLRREKGLMNVSPLCGYSERISALEVGGTNG